jgi:hypothetical protein
MPLRLEPVHEGGARKGKRRREEVQAGSSPAGQGAMRAVVADKRVKAG